ncbi:hypothetical protein BJY01DRAFT_256562 [Aspergillus pseudoustus]|uniref:Secreted protein n=1 Tax=Aspergillus pseudoustus TaxID=1810923 RepID=A0ABR4I822_9EURO
MAINATSLWFRILGSAIIGNRTASLAAADDGRQKDQTLFLEISTNCSLQQKASIGILNGLSRTPSSHRSCHWGRTT